MCYPVEDATQSCQAVRDIPFFKKNSDNIEHPALKAYLSTKIPVRMVVRAKTLINPRRNTNQLVKTFRGYVTIRKNTSQVSRGDSNKSNINRRTLTMSPNFGVGVGIRHMFDNIFVKNFFGFCRSPLSPIGILLKYLYKKWYCLFIVQVFISDSPREWDQFLSSSLPDSLRL